MKDVDEQFNHPQPVRHSDNKRASCRSAPPMRSGRRKNPKASRRSSDEGRRYAVQFAREH
ncbi:hypothetical protein [Paraburkholderia sp. MM5384-R2]|uniref:hypothetical protein n=1 Tax=Paraburkholderia sp. MM5384-R2 TaxID=2723097 RepID=UPI00160F21DD|nr:hypothetical protein [Paraburkholderia sp. MM5384-R2]MBB5497865.1 hypothetical protein [Paraburkholderia sp. MM5384-R2]